VAEDQHLEGIDPYAAWATEAARLDAHLRGRDDDDPSWDQPSRCSDWTVRDVLAHLLAEQDYFAACLSGTVGDLLAQAGARGATDVTSFNAMGIEDQAGKPPSQLLDEWRAYDERNRDGFRERGTGDVDTSIGTYPARWQAFHLASEVATHADDVGVPGRDDKARLAWRVPFSRFSLTEAKPDLTVEPVGESRTRVHGGRLDLTLDAPVFVEAVAGRTDDPALAPLSTSP